jgi:hypothetical protein
MTSLLAVISLAGVLTGSLYPGALPLGSRLIPRNLQPAAANHKAAVRSGSSTQVGHVRSRRASSAQLRPSIPSRSEEPVVIILYGDGPGSWM